jgi:hypothetical protein
LPAQRRRRVVGRVGQRERLQAVGAPDALVAVTVVPPEAVGRAARPRPHLLLRLATRLIEMATMPVPNR